MAHQWVFDVLDDLKLYAGRHNLSELQRQLEQASLVASVEIASFAQAEGGRASGAGHADGLRAGHRNHPAGANA